jgi:hypothetical protein
MGFADRLHHWVDSNGVTHLSKNPPPEDGRLVEIMEYSVRSDRQPKTEQAESKQPPEKPSGDLLDDKLQKPSSQPKPQKASATSCYINTGMQDIYLYVTEDKRPASPRVEVLWKGDISRGQKQLIKSKGGKIRYTYRRRTDDRTYGGFYADCVDGVVITIK